MLIRETATRTSDKRVLISMIDLRENLASVYLNRAGEHRERTVELNSERGNLYQLIIRFLLTDKA